jgi:hypothetical protein
VVLVRILFTLIPVLTRNSVLVALVEVLDNRLVAFSSTSSPPCSSRALRPCAPVSAVALTSRLRCSRCAISWPSFSTTHPRDLASAAQTGCFGFCFRSCGQTGGRRSRSSNRPRWCDGSAAPSQATGGGSHGHGAMAGSDRPRASRVDSTDAPSKPALGRALDSWRIVQARHRGVADDPREVHAASTVSSVTHVEGLLRSHVSELASIDFLTVPTAPFRVLFVFVVLSHARRHLLHLGVTAHPTTAWTRQQFREAFRWDRAPRFLIRDRDRIYGADSTYTVQAMGTEEVLTAPRSPWQNPFVEVERVIGPMRRECLDHVIIWSERFLRRILHMYVAYYNDVSYPAPPRLCA